jgi:hypothetical protein
MPGWFNRMQGGPPSFRLAGFLWASPYTLLGLSIGLLGLATGGRIRRKGRVLECYGGAVTWLVRRLPPGPLTLAMTLGHTILGQSTASLDLAHEHELVHVAQFERWGPLMGPAYLLASLLAWLRGGDAYRDNRFEREAYEADARRKNRFPS